MTDAVRLNRPLDWGKPKAESLVAFVVPPMAPPVAPIPVKPPVVAPSGPSAPIVPGADFGQNPQRAQEQRTLRTEFLLFGGLRDVPGQTLREAAYGASIPSHYEQGIRRALSERGDALGTARNTYSDAERREISEGVARVVGEMMADGIGAHSNAFGVGVRSAFDLAVAQIGARRRSESPGASPEPTRPTTPPATTPRPTPPPAAATPGAPSAGPAASVPPTVTYTPPPPPQPTVYGNADLTLGGSTYKLSNTSDGFQVTNPAHDVAFSVPASSLAEARDMVKGAWLSGTLPGPTPSESPLTVAGKGFSIVGNNGTYGLRDPAGAMPFQLPGRTLGEAAEHAREAYFTGQIPGFTPQSNPLTIGGQRLDIVGSHGDFGVVLPNGGYAGRVRADSLPNAAAQMESLYLEGRLPGMTPQARSVELEPGRSVNVTGTGGDGPYGIVDEAGALLARLRVPHSDGGTRNPQSFEEAAGAARAAFENGDLAPVGLAPVATTPPQNGNDGFVLYGPNGEPLPPSNQNEEAEEVPAAGGGGDLPPVPPPTNVVGTGGDDDEEEPSREQEWEKAAQFGRSYMKGSRRYSDKQTNRLLKEFEKMFKENTSLKLDDMKDMFKATTPDIWTRIEHALQHRVAIAGSIGVMSGTALTNLVSTLAPESMRGLAMIFTDPERAKMTDKIASFDFVAGQRAILSVGEPPVEELLFEKGENGERRRVDLTDTDTYLAARDKLNAWRGDRMKEVFEAMVENLALTKAQMTLLNAGAFVNEMAKAVNDPAGLSTSEAQSFFKLGSVNAWQGFVSSANGINSQVQSTTDAALRRLEMQRAAQLEAMKSSAGSAASANTSLIAAQIERATKLLSLEPDSDQKSDSTIDELRQVQSNFRSYGSELSNAQRELQNTLEALPEGYDLTSRQQLAAARDRLQDRADTATANVISLAATITGLENAQRADRRGESADRRGEVSELRAQAQAQVGLGRTAISSWNDSLGAGTQTIEGVPQIRLPFAGPNLFDLDAWAKESGGPDASAMNISHAAYLRQLDARDPNWIFGVAQPTEKPLSQDQVRQLKREIFDRVEAADSRAGRTLVPSQSDLSDILNRRWQPGGQPQSFSASRTPRPTRCDKRGLRRRRLPDTLFSGMGPRCTRGPFLYCSHKTGSVIVFPMPQLGCAVWPMRRLQFAQRR